MTWIDLHISLKLLIWLFILTFMIHDMEEIIFVESWMNKHYESARLAIPKPFRRGFDFFRNIKSSQFAVAVVLELIIFIPTTFIAAEDHRYLFFIGFNAVLLIHVITHIFQSILFRKYTPGVISAGFVTLPYTVYLFHRLVEAGILNWGLFNNSLDIGVLLVPLVILGHLIGKRIIPND